MKVFLKYFIPLILYFNTSAQQNKIDSIRNILKTSKEDTSKINLLILLTNTEYDVSQIQNALINAKQVLTLSEKLNNMRGEKRAHNLLGNLLVDLGNYSLAMQHHLKALQLSEKLDDKVMIAGSLSNIGLIYFILNNNEKALAYYEKSLVINKKINNSIFISANLNNIRLIYVKQNKYIEALEKYVQAKEIDKKINNKQGVASALLNMGDLYEDQGKLELALEYYLKSLKKHEGDRNAIALVKGNIGALYLRMKKFNDAEYYLHTSLAMCKRLGDLEGVEDMNHNLSSLYEALHNEKKALEYYKAYITTRDSLFNEENTKKIVRTEMNFEFEKKEAAAKLEKEKKEAVAGAESRKQKVIIWSICGILLLVFCFAVFAYRSYLPKQKANIEITKQKQVIEEKQKEILDSIYYARRIQQSLLPTEKYIEKNLKRLLKNN